MQRWWLVGGLLLGSVPVSADPRYEVGAGFDAEHLSGGTCQDGGFSAPCPGSWGAAFELHAAEVFALDRHVAVVLRELGGLGFSHRGMLARGYLGLGIRAQWSRCYAEVTGGGEVMFGDTGTGEGGIANGASLAVSPRLGIRFGRWSAELEAVVAPQVSDQIGNADFDIGVLASRTIGDVGPP